MVIQTRLEGATSVAAGLDAIAIAEGKVAVGAEAAQAGLAKTQRKGFLLMQTLFTARRVLYGFSLALGTAVAGTVALGFQFDSFKQQSTLAFTSLLGNAQAAKDEISLLFNIAAKTPFTFQNVTATARQFLAFGFSLKQTNQYLNVLGDTVSAFGLSGDQISHLAVVFGQIHQSGRLLGQDMRQLEQAGIPVFPALRKELGLTQAQIQAFMKGQLIIPSQYGIPAIMKYLQQRFGGMAAIQAKTFQGEASTFKDYLGQLMGTLEESLFNRATKSLGGVNDALTKLTKTAQTKGFTAFISQLDGMLGLGGKLVFAVNTLKDAFITFYRYERMVWGVSKDLANILIYMFVPLYLVFKAVEWLVNNGLVPLKYVLYVVLGSLVAWKIAMIYVRIATLLWAAATGIATFAMWLQQAAIVAVFVATEFLNVARKDGIAYALYTMAVNIGLVGAYEAVTAAASSAAAATWAFTIALLSNPITWVVLGTIALIAVFTILMVKVKAFREFMLHYGGFIMLWIPGLQIVGTVLLIIGYFKQLQDAFGGTVDFMKNHWKDFILFFLTFGVGNLLYHFWDPIVTNLTIAVNWIKGIFNDLFSWITSHAKDALDPRNWIPFGLGSLVGGKGKVGFSWKDLLKIGLPGPLSGIFADGGVTPHRGYAVVGEKGPELVWLPGGSHVRPLAPVPDTGAFQQLPAAGQAGPRELTIHVPVHLNDGVLGNTFAKLMLDQMARA
jgi:tape measure domain-containing protein